jgi:predicted metal-dependent hydrolase
MDFRADEDRFEEGVELFNAGRFFECHEAWEEVWKRERGAKKLFLQGMIQAAAAILHVERGNRAGAKSLYAKARAKLDPLPYEYMGLALGEFREAMREFFAKAFYADGGGPLPAPPRLRRLTD